MAMRMLIVLLLLVVETLATLSSSVDKLGRSTEVLSLISLHMASSNRAGDACLIMHVDNALRTRYLKWHDDMVPSMIFSSDNETMVEEANEECVHMLLTLNTTQKLDLLLEREVLSLRSIVMVIGDDEELSVDFMPRLTRVHTDGRVARMTSDSKWRIVGHIDEDLEKLPTLLLTPKSLDLMGTRLEAKAVVYPPWYSERRLGDGSVVAEGIEVSLVDHVVQALNASVVTATPSDGGLWGEDRENTGNFDGLAGALQRGEASLGFAQLFVKLERTAIMDFSREYDVDRVCFLTTISKPLPQSLALVRPFTLGVWSWVLITMIFSILFMSIHLKLASEKRTAATETPGRRLLLLLSVLAVESDVSFPKVRHSPMRLFLVAYSLSCVVLSGSYSSGMTSLLTVPMRNPPINTVQGVAKSGMATASLGGSVFIMATSTDKWIGMMRADHLSLEFSKPLLEVFGGAANRSYTLYQSEQFLRHTVRKDFSNAYGETEMHVVPECPEAFNVALGLVKKSILKPYVDRVIQSFKEAGLIQRWTKVQAGKYGKMEVHEKNDVVMAEAFTLSNLEGPFLALAISLLCPCFGIFVLEILLRQRTVQGNH